jgi:hypothetical protein
MAGASCVQVVKCVRRPASTLHNFQRKDAPWHLSSQPITWKDGSKGNNTHPDIQNLLLRYLRGHGSISCLDCAIAFDLPPIMQRLVISQDNIGWDHFMMGIVSKLIAKIQRTYLFHSNSSRTASLWIAGLITQLPQVMYAQWIYKCILVHDWNTGTLISAHKENLLKEIEHQLALGPDGLTEEDKFLLIFNFDELATTNGKHQEH